MTTTTTTAEALSCRPPEDIAASANARCSVWFRNVLEHVPSCHCASYRAKIVPVPIAGWFSRITGLNPGLVWWNGRAKAEGISALGYPVERVPKAITSQDTQAKAVGIRARSSTLRMRRPGEGAHDGGQGVSGRRDLDRGRIVTFTGSPDTPHGKNYPRARDIQASNATTKAG